MSEALKLNDLSFLREVETLSHAKVSACLQCHKCSAGCPVGKETDWRSSQIMRLVQLGEKETLLGSKAIWLCASCEACSSRCPMDIDVSGVMDALRIVAASEGGELSLPKTELFNRSFLKSVGKHGRVFEMGMMAGYTMKTGTVFRNMGKASKMFFRGRLALMPSKSGGRKQVKEAMKRVREKEKAK